MLARTTHAAFISALLAGAAAAPLAAPAAFAQEEQASEDDRDAIVVTARRREETLQDVPLAVTAFTGDQLEKVGAQDIIAIAQSTPNITLEVSRGTNTTLTAFIRGVGQQDPVAGFEAGVGLYIDDVYLNRPQAAVLDIFDVERIEVLRGPQGTLYGRNTIGGAIKYVTRRLNPDAPELRAKINVGTFSQFDQIITASAPLTDTFRVGGAIANFNRDGFGENVITGLDNYNKDILAGRLSAEWEPTGDLFFRLTADRTQDDSNPRQGHRLIPSLFSGAPVLDDVFDTRSGLNTPEQEVESQGVSLLGEWSVNDKITFKNILAYREDDSLSPIDFDSLPTDDVDVPVNYANHQFSQELQALYEGDRLAGVVGFYYLSANAFNVFDVILGPTGDLIGIPGLNGQTFGDVDTRSWSVFGDFTYDLTDTLSLSFGGRFTTDERSVTIQNRLFTGGLSPELGGNAIPIEVRTDFNDEEEFTDFSPRASISWRPVDEHNLYFTYSQGFKGGGFDPRGRTDLVTALGIDIDGDGDVDDDDVREVFLFDPEIVDTFEAGVKSSLLGNRVNTALAIFYSDYSDVQVPGSAGVDSDGDGVNETFVGTVSNAGAATIFGVEFEGQALLAEDMAQSGDDLSLSWSLGYLDAEYDEFIDSFGNDVSDERVFQNTPEFVAAGTLSYAAPLALGPADGELFASGSVSYRGDTSQFEVPNALLDQDAYTLIDASLVWEQANGRWRVGLHGRNLTDEEYIVAGYNFGTLDDDLNFTPSLGLEGILTGFYGDPRTFTATLEFRY